MQPHTAALVAVVAAVIGTVAAVAAVITGAGVFTAVGWVALAVSAAVFFAWHGFGTFTD